LIPFFSSGMYTGPIARALGGADIAMLVGLPVAAGVYLLACRSIDLTGTGSGRPPRTWARPGRRGNCTDRVIVSTIASCPRSWIMRGAG